ncbi:hypothetical protein TBK1r_32820 [Stieleria magnilauensis]|uniref:Uncharacterized protein n=1 Tax=Stieleria magnilauensis TaxID=2527963 RepID=A0ABX5XQQ6_9BACT|nr:hypothetical protein TBK1r_32820 [Planctomycetes bacterium TBK1r]
MCHAAGVNAASRFVSLAGLYSIRGVFRKKNFASMGVWRSCSIPLGLAGLVVAGTWGALSRPQALLCHAVGVEPRRGFSDDGVHATGRIPVRAMIHASDAIGVTPQSGATTQPGVARVHPG